MKQDFCLIIPYFGPWPEWMELFLLSCAANPGVNWYIVGDHPAHFSLKPDNVTFQQVDFEDFKSRVRTELDLPFDLPSAYKLNDLKPALGYLFRRELESFAFWGYSDLDLIYGRLEDWLNQRKHYRVISTHADLLSGHLCVLRNTPRLREAFRGIRHWKELLRDPLPRSVDEVDFNRVFSGRSLHPKRIGHRFIRRVIPPSVQQFVMRIHMKEAHTTPLTPRPWRDGTLLSQQPLDWKWESGKVFSLRDGMEAPYFHFMNFKSIRWNPEKVCPWENLSKLVHFVPTRETKAFLIDRTGFHSSVEDPDFVVTKFT